MKNMRISLNIKNGILSALIFIIASGIPAHAVPISVTGNGIVWTLSGDAKPGVDTSGSFTLSADVSGWTEGPGTWYLSEFSLKNFGSDATMSNLVAPAGSWNWVNEGLNANGCKTNGTSDALCAFNDGTVTSAPSTSSDFLFSFTVSLTDFFPDYTHLKVRWVDEDGKKVGDLISKDITWVPAPAILGVMGIGLIGMVLSSGLRRRKLS